MRYKAKSLPRFNRRLVACRIRCGSRSNQTSKCQPWSLVAAQKERTSDFFD